MAIALVQSTGSGTGSAGYRTISLSSPTMAGDTIVLAYIVGGYPLPTWIPSATDDAGNTYVVAPNALSSYTNATPEVNLSGILYCTNCLAGASTITFSFSYPGGTLSGVFVYAGEFSGVGSFDAANNQVGTTGVPSSLSITPSDPSGLLLSIILPQTSDPTGVNSPWVILPNGLGHFFTAYVIAPGGASAPTYIAASQVYQASIISFDGTGPITHTITPSDSMSSSDSITSNPIKVVSDSDDVQVIAETIQVIRNLGPLDYIKLNEWLHIELNPSNRWTNFDEMEND